MKGASGSPVIVSKGYIDGLMLVKLIITHGFPNFSHRILEVYTYIYMNEFKLTSLMMMKTFISTYTYIEIEKYIDNFLTSELYCIYILNEKISWNKLRVGWNSSLFHCHELKIRVTMFAVFVLAKNCMQSIRHIYNIAM